MQLQKRVAIQVSRFMAFRYFGRVLPEGCADSGNLFRLSGVVNIGGIEMAAPGIQAAADDLRGFFIDCSFSSVVFELNCFQRQCKEEARAARLARFGF